MSGTAARAVIVEAFPMRLGSEILFDVTLEPEAGEPGSIPGAEDTVTLHAGDRELELTVWAAPRIAHPEGSARFNLQFRRDDLPLEPAAGMKLSW